MFSFYFWVQFGKLLIHFALFTQKKKKKNDDGVSKEWEETEKPGKCKDRDEQTIRDGSRPVGSFRSSFGDAVSGVRFWLSGRNRSTRSKSKSVAYDFKLPTQKPSQEAHSSGWYLSFIGSLSSYILTTGYLLSADFVLIFLPVLPTYQLNFCILKQQQQIDPSTIWLILEMNMQVKTHIWTIWFKMMSKTVINDNFALVYNCCIS